MQLSPSTRSLVEKKLADHFRADSQMQWRPVGGGSINDTYRLAAGEKTLFCKINSATKFPHLFAREKHGLEMLATHSPIKTPAVVACIEEDSWQALVLDWVEEGNRTGHFWTSFGEQLAALHRVTSAHHGLEEDNYMGSVPQQNNRHKSWAEFFWAERLAPMSRRCAGKQLLQSHHLHRFDALQQKLVAVFEEEPPSLLHGDLWSGNFLCNAASEPVLIDPAVYFGHRSMDLAMTTLFGGFGQPFYDAYQHHFPLPTNFKEQWAVCNLYPLLIHLYLFGSGYLSQIERTLKQFA